MDELKKRLTKEIGQDLQVQIKHSQIWNLPIDVLKVDFETVRQTKMDVLMKMLLIAFREAEFSEVGEISEVLLVESIFIENIIEKMQRAGLIEKEQSIFRLTDKGSAQLKAETFIEQPEEGTENLLYSPCHSKLLPGELDESGEDEYEDYRFYDNYSDWDVDSIRINDIQDRLQALIPVSETPNVQTVISEIHSVTPIISEVIPCLEFHLYHKEKDIFYARVWNTLLNEWDEKLEGQINSYDRATWREVYLNQPD